MPFLMNNSVTISTAQSHKLGSRLDQLKPQTEDFLDPQLFPSQNNNPADIANFFFFVTGIDHRTSPLNQSFEGTVEGNYFQGADLLWHLSLQKFIEKVFDETIALDLKKNIMIENMMARPYCFFPIDKFNNPSRLKTYVQKHPCTD